MQILLVDDNDEFRGLTANSLSRAGYSVRAVNGAEEAWRMLGDGPVDLIITDLVMPGEDGMELIQKVRREFPDVPLIAISGESAHSSLYLKIAGKLGADNTLLKPFSTDELLAAIQRAQSSLTTATPAPLATRLE